ncbi:cobalt-precorrin-5B (C(1))-methyltransferase [Calditerricola satsumensis]|uniref:Cobalt-precorrin-5B C(1)-methyltransferase n=1 Tax=Calditerricola satsumensis TaxID=373054 RepID=A0A8J3FAS8_9BACI|nr:cobalt-precorrin-5B (C(1))-methyltransferase [Calditerricola satsumensis]GGJ93563.1 cobalt-precorrin-5B C(1)-methyltransferase [Calditerricola satsumensis]
MTASLRHGYTTGACAAAATKAATLALVTQRPVAEVTIPLPAGISATFPVEDLSFSAEMATCCVVKDAGDDPDVTHGARIYATVMWRNEPGIEIDGGPGVGRVTRPGLPVPVGEAAINPVPRRMIREAAEGVLAAHNERRGVRVVISVPGGEEMAKKTLNARLGIIGGISILGTRGIVVPFSTAAYRASVAQAIRVAKANGCDHLVLTTGGRSEAYARARFPNLPEMAFIQMGDFVGFALQHCRKQSVARVSLVGMMGKFSKVACGVMMVHAKSAPVDFAFLARLAEDVGAPPDLVEAVRAANTANQVADLLRASGYTAFFTRLAEAICRACLAHVGGGMTVETVLVTLNGEELGRAVLDGKD